MAIRTGAVTPIEAPVKGEHVECADRGVGIVQRTAKGTGGAAWVKFPGSDVEVMYTHRRALNRWLAFPGDPDAQGLQL